MNILGFSESIVGLSSSLPPGLQGQTEISFVAAWQAAQPLVGVSQPEASAPAPDCVLETLREQVLAEFAPVQTPSVAGEIVIAIPASRPRRQNACAEVIQSEALVKAESDVSPPEIAKNLTRPDRKPEKRTLPKAELALISPPGEETQQCVLLAQTTPQQTIAPPTEEASQPPGGTRAPRRISPHTGDSKTRKRINPSSTDVSPPLEGMSSPIGDIKAIPPISPPSGDVSPPPGDVKATLTISSPIGDIKASLPASPPSGDVPPTIGDGKAILPVSSPSRDVSLRMGEVKARDSISPSIEGISSPVGDIKGEETRLLQPIFSPPEEISAPTGKTVAKQPTSPPAGENVPPTKQSISPPTADVSPVIVKSGYPPISYVSRPVRESAARPPISTLAGHVSPPVGESMPEQPIFPPAEETPSRPRPSQARNLTQQRLSPAILEVSPPVGKTEQLRGDVTSTPPVRLNNRIRPTLEAFVPAPTEARAPANKPLAEPVANDKEVRHYQAAPIQASAIESLNLGPQFRANEAAKTTSLPGLIRHLKIREATPPVIPGQVTPPKPLLAELLQRIEGLPSSPKPLQDAAPKANVEHLLPLLGEKQAREESAPEGKNDSPSESPASFFPLLAEAKEAPASAPESPEQTIQKQLPDAMEHAQRLARQQGQALLDKPRELELHLHSNKLGEVAARLKVEAGGQWTAHVQLRDAQVEQSVRQELQQIQETRGLEGFTTSLSQDSRDQRGAFQGFSFDQQQARGWSGYLQKKSPTPSTSDDPLPIARTSSVHGNNGLNVRA